MKLAKLGSALAAVELALAVKAMWGRIPAEDREEHIKNLKKLVGAGTSFVTTKVGGTVSHVKEFVGDKNLPKGEARLKKETKMAAKGGPDAKDAASDLITVNEVVDAEVVAEAFNIVDKAAEDEEIIVEVTSDKI